MTSDTTLADIIDEFMIWLGQNPGVTPEDIGVKTTLIWTPHGPMNIFTPEAIINSNYYEISGATPPKEIIN